MKWKTFQDKVLQIQGFLSTSTCKMSGTTKDLKRALLRLFPGVTFNESKFTTTISTHAPMGTKSHCLFLLSPIKNANTIFILTPFA